MKNTDLLSVHDTFIQIGNMLNYKTSQNKSQKLNYIEKVLLSGCY